MGEISLSSEFRAEFFPYICKNLENDTKRPQAAAERKGLAGPSLSSAFSQPIGTRRPLFEVTCVKSLSASLLAPK